MSPLVGHLLSDRYRLDAQIGTGGMSTVYRAFDTTLERPVAVKLMHREMSTDTDQLERFRREARAVAQLSHPHIVSVIDAGEDDHRPFIVLEYVEGETLKDLIRRKGRLQVDEAIAYAIEIGRALQAAHARGIVHRDIKPQNVLIDGERSAKVTDFGIARSLDEDGLTAEGRVLGTTDYVSPEQALGHAVNGQSDLYSLGVVLYEMLTGDVPFHGENQVAVAMKHVREEIPDIQVRRPDVSATLAAILDHLTAKDLAVRYPDALSAVQDLEDALAIEASRTGRATGEATAVLKTLPSDARRRVPLRMRWQIPLAGIVVASLVIAGVLFLVLHEAADRAQRGAPEPRAQGPAGSKPVRVKSASANDYDPAGDDKQEHPEAADRAVDENPSTFWLTSTYQGDPPNLGKPGVGLYVDAEPEVQASQIVLRARQTGFDVEILGADGDDPPETIDQGWTRLGGGNVNRKSKTFKLDTREPYRYYLVWITSLPSEGKVELSEVRLYRPSKPA